MVSACWGACLLADTRWCVLWQPLASRQAHICASRARRNGPHRPSRCVWDDRQGMYGDRRPYVLHFYLEDDTVEINEVRAPIRLRRAC